MIQKKKNKAVEKAFTNRVKSLRSRYKEKEIPQAERASEKSEHSQQQQVSLYLLSAVSQLVIYNFKCSCFIVVVMPVAKLFDPLKWHLNILETLGPNGMSSDESGVDCNTKQLTYTIVKPDWQHPELHNWLKVFDQLHHQNHINSWSLDKRGAFPHIRIRSQKVHRKVHVPAGLPINTYDPTWLDGREALYLKHVLCPKEERYNFSHSSDVIV